MGNCDFKKQEPTTNVGISKINFQMHYVIGRGGYGKVNKLIFLNFYCYFSLLFYPLFFYFYKIITKLSQNYLKII